MISGLTVSQSLGTTRELGRSLSARNEAVLRALISLCVNHAAPRLVSSRWQSLES